jgi:subtilisin family serine protease
MDMFSPREAVLSPMSNRTVDVEVLVDGVLTDDVLAELEGLGKVTLALRRSGGVGMKIKEADLAALIDLPFVTEVGYSVIREVHEDYASNGINTWDLDIMNVTEFVPTMFPPNRVVTETGDGVYVAVLDTGLVHNWRDYFPEDRIATDLAKAFAGGGNDVGNVSNPANKWERDTHSHGTHVSSTILGYSIYGFYNVNGVAPKATVIPVKVLNNNGSGWSAMVAAGIESIGSLKEDGIIEGPVVINMSLGGPELALLEKDAIDYAIDQGVIVVASAGNEGWDGMGYPGAYEPVISVGACGWIYEWAAPSWWHTLDVAEPTNPDEIYITDFSSRELGDQDLDVVAPGSWIVGPFLAYGAAHPPYWASGVPGQYYYLGGTSMAAPHVAGVAALMLEKNSSLTQVQIDAILAATALSLLPAWGDEEAGAGMVLADDALAAVP